MKIKCKGSWRPIRAFYRTIRLTTCAKNRMLCARESSMSSIEIYTQISEQDLTQLNIFQTMNFYHGQLFLETYFVEIFDSLPVPLSKITSFDAARRTLSNGVSQITITTTNVNILIQKGVKQASKKIFHLPIRSRTCATYEKYSIRLTLRFSIH
jgi:hypothetical protein